jgi:hypothetical protein
MDLGAVSISLAVKDLEASRARGGQLVMDGDGNPILVDRHV